MALRRVAFVEQSTGFVVNECTYDTAGGRSAESAAPAGQIVVDVPATLDITGQRWNGTRFVARTDLPAPVAPVNVTAATDRQLLEAIARRLGVG